MMMSRVTRSVWIIALLLASSMTSGPASAVDLFIHDSTTSMLISDNGIGDANLTTGVIDVLNLVTADGVVISDLRCEVESGFSADPNSINWGKATVAPVLPATYASITNSGSSAVLILIQCEESLGFEMYGPGSEQWLGDGLADDPSPGNLDTPQIDFNTWPMSDPLVAVLPGGPCPFWGGPQPCPLAVGYVFDYIGGTSLIGNSASVDLTADLGAGDRVRITELEYLIAGGHYDDSVVRVPALSPSGLAILIASFFGTGFSVMLRRGRDTRTNS